MEFRIKQVEKDRFLIEENRLVKKSEGSFWWKKTYELKLWLPITHRELIGLHFYDVPESFESLSTAQTRVTELKIDYPIYHSAMANSPG